MHSDMNVKFIQQFYKNTQSTEVNVWELWLWVKESRI